MSPNSVRNITEKTRVTAPNAERPTSATPPDTLATPLVISLACCVNASSESLPLLTKLPSSLRLASSTIRGRSSLKSRTAPTTACVTTSTTAPRTITIVSTSTAADSLRLQRSRRSIALTTGERTATLKMETKMTRRTFAIDASAHATATTPATSRIVRIDTETSSWVRRAPRPAKRPRPRSSALRTKRCA